MARDHAPRGGACSTQRQHPTRLLALASVSIVALSIAATGLTVFAVGVGLASAASQSDSAASTPDLAGTPNAHDSAINHCSGTGEACFTEELLLRPLPDGRVTADFQFTSRWRHPPAAPRAGGDSGPGGGVHADSSAATTSESLLTTHGERSFFDNFDAFPRALARVVHEHGVRELAFTLRRGRWEYDRWGAPTRAAPGGAELKLWLPRVAPGGRNVTAAGAKHGTTPDEALSAVANVLAGAYCARVNLMVSAHPNTCEAGAIETLSSTGWTLRAASEGGASAGGASGTRFAYATLPREGVCTENLSPWIKSLPCRARAGLATLINPRRVFESRYHALGVELRQVCDDADSGGAQRPPRCLTPALEMRHFLTVVLDTPSVSAFGSGAPPPRMWQSHIEWDLASLFRSRTGGSTKGTPTNLTSLCPAAKHTRVYVEVDGEDVDDGVARELLEAPRAADRASFGPRSGYLAELLHDASRARLSPQPDFVVPLRRAADPRDTSWLAGFDLDDMALGGGAFNLSAAWGSAPGVSAERPSCASGAVPRRRTTAAPVAVARFLTGAVAHRRGVTTWLTSQLPDTDVNVTLVEVLPWFIRPRLHTHMVSVQRQRKAAVGGDHGGGGSGNGERGSSGNNDNGETGQEGGQQRQWRDTVPQLVSGSGIVHTYDVSPAELRGRPTLIATHVTVPAGSRVALSMSFDTAFLTVEEFPADPNHGFELPAAVAYVHMHDDAGMVAADVAIDCVGSSTAIRRRVVHAFGAGDDWSPLFAQGHAASKHATSGAATVLPVYTESLLVDMPLPDFSMPYNVITLTSSVASFFFGTMLNFLGRSRKRTRKARTQAQGTGKPSLLQRVRSKCGGRQGSTRTAVAAGGDSTRAELGAAAAGGDSPAAAPAQSEDSATAADDDAKNASDHELEALRQGEAPMDRGGVAVRRRANRSRGRQ